MGQSRHSHGSEFAEVPVCMFNVNIYMFGFKERDPD